MLQGIYRDMHLMGDLGILKGYSDYTQFWVYAPYLHRGADKSLAFPIFLFAAEPKEFFLDGLKKLEQQSHKCVELRGEYVE
jgi:hypothetical protein